MCCFVVVVELFSLVCLGGRILCSWWLVLGVDSVVSLVRLVMVVVILVFVVFALVRVCAGLIKLEGLIGGDCTRVSIRLGEEGSLVPGLIRAIGNCTTRRGKILRRMAGTETKIVGTSSVRRADTTSGRLANTLGSLFTITRGCPSLGTGDGFRRLRDRLDRARSGVTCSERFCGSIILGCGGTYRRFPDD